MATSTDPRESSMIEEGAPAPTVATDLEGSDLATAKAAFTNARAATKANWDREVEARQVRVIVIPSNSRMGQRDPQGVAVQVNGVKYPKIELDRPVEIVNSVADIIERALEGEKEAIEREQAFSDGRLVIPIGGQ